MTSYRPTKKELEIARELHRQMQHLTCRWHLDFTEEERVTIRKALECLQKQYIAAKP